MEKDICVVGVGNLPIVAELTKAQPGLIIVEEVMYPFVIVLVILWMIFVD